MLRRHCRHCAHQSSWMRCTIPRCSGKPSPRVHFTNTGVRGQQRNNGYQKDAQQLPPRPVPGKQTGDRKRTAAAVILSTIFLGGVATYKQVQSFKESFKLTTPAVENEHLHSSFIYVEDNVLGDYEQVSPKKEKKRKHKKPWFPWLQSRGHDPWTLLRLAQSDDHSIRLLGVQALAEEHHWTDAEYQMLAQALDNRTVVGLARSQKADPRFFLPKPHLPQNLDSLEDRLRQLLSSLPTDNIDKCTKYFTSAALQEGSKASKEERDNQWGFAGFGWLAAQPANVTSSPQVELLCLTALLGHSQVPSHCSHVIKAGGLQVLKEIYENRQGSIKIVRTVGRILANLAVQDELHDDIINMGWVKILAEWAKSSDIGLSLHASKALANLDSDFGTRRYMDGVYLYYPQQRYTEPVYSDIVFVHGLLGGPFRTWRQGDPDPKVTTPDPNIVTPASDEKGGLNVEEKTLEVRLDEPKDVVEGQTDEQNKDGAQPYTWCWPKDWLAKDCPHVRILTVEYETHLSEWAPKCPFESEKRSLASRSADLLRKLRRAGVGERPVIWVGHSMGGLLIKQMLTTAKSSSVPQLQRLVNNSKGIIFYSVPHRGAPLAAYGNHTKYIIYPSVEVKELHQGSEQLLSLHEKFKELMFDHGIPLLSFAEGDKTQLPLNMKILMVPRESSDPGFGEFHFMESLNHLEICKPANRMAPLYQMTLDFIRDCIPLNLVENILRANIPEEYILPEDFEM